MQIKCFKQIIDEPHPFPILKDINSLLHHMVCKKCWRLYTTEILKMFCCGVLYYVIMYRYMYDAIFTLIIWWWLILIKAHTGITIVIVMELWMIEWVSG